MTVGSYLEIFTTLNGWRFYDILWTILSGTGLVFLPFFGLVLNAFVESYKQQSEVRDASASSQNIVEVELALMFTVVVLAGQPFMTIAPAELSFTPACAPPGSPAAATATGSSTGTTLDHTFGASPPSPSVPIWWDMVMSISAGINKLAIDGIGCAPPVRAIARGLQSIQIEDKQLRVEYERFANECYLPALSKYQRLLPDVSSVTATYGPDDTEWPGSHVFQSVSGYYDIMHARRAVPGWPGFDANFNPIPNCNDWWSDASRGIKQRLIAESGGWRARVLAFLASALPGTGALSSDTDDIIIRRLLANSAPASFSPDAAQGGEGQAAAAVGGTAAVSALGASLAGVGALPAVLLGGASVATSFGTTLAEYYAGMFILKKVSYMVQALILMAIYGFLAIAVVASRYSFSLMITGGIAIFTVKFWTVIWRWADWIDANLYLSMYPDAKYLFDPTSASTMERVMLDMVTTGLYILLPLVFSGVMAWVGVKGNEAWKGFNNTTGEIKTPPSKGFSDAAGGASRSLQSQASKRVR